MSTRPVQLDFFQAVQLIRAGEDRLDDLCNRRRRLAAIGDTQGVALLSQVIRDTAMAVSKLRIEFGLVTGDTEWEAKKADYDREQTADLQAGFVS